MKSQKILIVDDEPLNISLYFDMLQQNNFQIISAADGIEAVQKTHEELPDLIIMDWNMPRLDGLEALKKLKGFDKTKDIPVIMITGVMTSSESLMTALNEGANDFLRKPFNEIELRARINSMLLLSSTINELRNKFCSIKENHKSIYFLIENAPHPLVFYTQNGIILGCNDQFSVLAKKTRDELIGKFIYLLCDRVHSEIHMNVDEELIQTKEGKVYQSQFGSEKHIFIFSKSPFYNPEGEIEGILCVMIDLSELENGKKEMLERKNKEILLCTLKSIQASEGNKLLISEINKIAKYSNKEVSEMIRTVVNKYTVNSNENFWRDLELRFENVYDQFYKVLKERFPILTPVELRLCAYLRMNISTKDIASITFQNIQSIEMARYRLRKKLKIDSKENLIDFLMRI